jgi:catechol 2,3-dioxygenase-like lactoylglutathione lyase family enzyme
MTNNAHIGRVVILVNNYDEALQFYTEALGCTVTYDETLPDGQRYLHLAWGNPAGCGIWLMLATSAEARLQVGRQTAGHPVMVWYTHDFENMVDHLLRHNVQFKERPAYTPTHKALHFHDIYGNEILLIELMEELV